MYFSETPNWVCKSEGFFITWPKNEIYIKNELMRSTECFCFLKHTLFPFSLIYTPGSHTSSTDQQQKVSSDQVYDATSAGIVDGLNLLDHYIFF